MVRKGNLKKDIICVLADKTLSAQELLPLLHEKDSRRRVNTYMIAQLLRSKEFVKVGKDSLHRSIWKLKEA